MKKAVKLLIPILILVIFAITFSVLAFADEKNSETKSNNGWELVDDPATEIDETTAAYAVWASETDYIAGDVSPTLFYDSAMTDATVGKDSTLTVGYIKLYKNVTMTALTTKAGVPLVFDLNGFGITYSSQFQISSAYGDKVAKTPTTFKNGSLTTSGVGRIFPSTGATLYFENVTLTTGNTFFINDAGAMSNGGQYNPLWYFKDSTFISNSAEARFDLNGYGAYRNAIIFENTDVIYTVSPTTSLFTVNANKYHQQFAFDITFDENSSVIAPGMGNNWLTATVGLPVTTNIYFEEGFTASTENLPKDGIFGATALGSVIGDKEIIPADPWIRFTVVNPDTLDVIKAFEYRDNGDGTSSIVRKVVTHNPLPEVIENEVEVACTKEGSYDKVTYCADCGEVVSRVHVVVPSEGHKYDGEVCTVCGGYLSYWNPTDPNVKYAVWSSESAYLNGEEPVRQYTDAYLTSDTIGKSAPYTASYVRLFADVDVNVGIQTALSQNIIIDLGGFTLNLMNGQFKFAEDNYGAMAEGSAEIKNGSINHTGGCFYPYPGIDLRFTDISLKSSSDMFMEDCGTRSVVFDGCTLVFESASANMQISAKYNSPSFYKFVNTDIIQTVSTDKALIILSESAYNLDLQHKVIFDKDSTIMRTTSNLVMLKENYIASTYCKFTKTQYVLFEEGCTFSTDAIPDLKYTLYDVDSAGTYLGNTKVNSGALVDGVVSCVIAVCKVGYDEPIEYFDFIDNGDGTATASEIVYNHKDGEPVIENLIESTCTAGGSYDVVIYCTECGKELSRKSFTTPPTGHTFEGLSCTVCGAPKEKWKPSDDSVKFAIFESESAYLDCMDPLAYFSDAAFTTDNIGSNASVRGGYILLFADVSVGAMNTLAGQEIVFDLNGHTLTVMGEFKLGNNYSDTALKTPVTFRNGYIHVKSSRIYPNTGCSLLIENVEMTVDSTYIIDDSGSMTKNGEYGHSIHLKDTVVYINNPAARLSLSGYGTGENSVLFENTDFIYLVTPTVPLLEVKYNKYFKGYSFNIRFDKDSSIKGGRGALIHMTATMPITDKVFIEEGFSANPEYFKNGFTYSVGETGIGADPVCVISVVLPGTDEPIGLRPYAVDVDGDGLYSIASDKGSAAWYISGGSAPFVIAGGDVNSSDTPILSENEIGLAGVGTDLILLSDVRLESDSVIVLPEELGIDLGGFRLLVAKGLSLNGTLSLSDGEVIYSGDGSFVDGTGSLIIDGVTLKLGSSPIISTAVAELYINESSIEADGVLVMAGSVRITITDSEISSEYILSSDLLEESHLHVSDSSIIAKSILKLSRVDGNVSVVISDSYVSAAIAQTNRDVSEYVTVSISETYLKYDPKVSSDLTVILAEGENLLVREDSEYSFRVSTVDFSIRAGLVLNSDFTLYFYLPTNSGIESFVFAGKTYSVSELGRVEIFGYGEYYTAQLECITPASAEENLHYSIEFMKDGILHRVDSYYSVVEYLSSIYDSDYTHVVKRLATATLEYIRAAYVYSDKDCVMTEELLKSEKAAPYVIDKELPTVSDADMSPVISAVKSIQLDLGSTMRYRVNLNEDYTGSLKIGERSYDVNNGTVGELNYVEIPLRAYDMFDTVLEIELSDGSTGAYSLSAYVVYINSSPDVDKNTKELVNAFYFYCKYADLYVGLYE